MSDNRRYYYLKLKDHFFDNESMVLLESMQDGTLYINLLLKLYCLSLKNNGKLLFNDEIPYTPQMIATVTRQTLGVVEKAISIFTKLRLMEVIYGDVLYMSNIELHIGQSSTEGERKRIARSKHGQMSAICPPKIEREKERELEPKREQPTRTAYGKYLNVFLSVDEQAELQKQYPHDWETYVERLSVFMKSSGKTYADHCATLVKWLSEDQKKTACPLVYEGADSL